MWAACCNWFCLNGQPEEIQHRPQPGTRAYANAGYSSFPSPTGSEQSCKACGARFGSASLKRICLDCKKDFCPACAHQPESGPCLCHLCERFRATAFRREELIKMKVKELRDYLELREISTELCREKDELVCLIMGQRPAGAQAEQPPCVPPVTPVPSAPESCFPATASLGPFLEQAPAEPASPTAQQPQANGHVPPSQQDMAEVENAVETLVEEETQNKAGQPRTCTSPEPDSEESKLAGRPCCGGAQAEKSTDSEDTLVAGRRASLSDLTSASDIDGLSVRQLKEILARNFVNYKGCCEKWELMERVTRLYKEKDLQQLVSDTDDQTALAGGAATLPGSEENLCKICMDAAIDCVLLECGHMVTCTKCGMRMSECPICRQYVIRAVHVFRT